MVRRLPVPEGVIDWSPAARGVHPQDLQPSTVYHYRVVVGNLVRGEVAGPDQTLRPGTGAESVADGRATSLAAEPAWRFDIPDQKASSRPRRRRVAR